MANALGTNDSNSSSNNSNSNSSTTAVNAPNLAPPSAMNPPTAAPARAVRGLHLKLRQLQAGAQVVLPDGSTIVTPAGPVTKADVVAHLGTALAAYTAVDDQSMALARAKVALKVEAPSVKALYQAYRDGIIAALGRTSPLLAKFGLRTAVARRQLTSAQKLARAAKNAATRKLRGTVGAKKKRALQYAGGVAVSAQLDPTVAPPPVVVAGPAKPEPAAPPAAASPGTGRSSTTT